MKHVCWKKIEAYLAYRSYNVVHVCIYLYLFIIAPTQRILNYVWTFKTKLVGSNFFPTLIQRLDNIEIRRRTWQRCIDVENRLFDVATKYQRRYNVE